MVKLSELLKREKAFGKTNRAEIKWAPRKVVTALSNGKINGLPGGSTIYIFIYIYPKTLFRAMCHFMCKQNYLMRVN